VSKVLTPIVRRPWLHAFAILLAASTLALVATGAFVTTNEERPFYSVGQFHTPVAWIAAVLAAGLVLCLHLVKTTAWLRRLGWIVLAIVLAEVALGTQMDLESPAILALHGLLAQMLFSTTVVIAVLTSGGWNQDVQPAEDSGRPSSSSLAAVALALTCIQITLGVSLRHALITVGLHILGAFLVVLLMLILAVLVARQHPGQPALRAAANTAATTVSIQAFLGFTILSMQGSRLIPPVAMIVAAAIHATVGALALSATVVLVLVIRRKLRPAYRGADPEKRAEERAPI
jgi:heme A synthase